MRGVGEHAPWFVARKDMAANTLWVVQGHDHPWLLSNQLDAGQANWIAGVAPAAGTLSAKTRYRQADVDCRVLTQGPDRFTLDFTDPQWAVTPGQSAVLYDRYWFKKSRNGRSPMKQMPVESFLAAFGSSSFSAILRTSVFGISPSGNKVLDSCAWFKRCRK